MGPDLWELFEEGNEEDEIAAIIRLGHYAVVPQGVRVVTQFSEIITVRLQRRNIPRVSGAPEVAGMIAGDNYLGPDLEVDSAEMSADTVLPTDERRPMGLITSGHGVVIGAIDWGFDFAHPDFRKPDGSTRILALWDQRGGKRPNSPQPFGYGVVHDRAVIDRALKEKDPYAALQYHPADADTRDGAHGTHVVSIAAGSGGDGRPIGMAPEADLVLVHNAPFDEQESGKLGDSVTLLEGIDFIARTAGDRPWVINTSLGRHGEQHDGSTLIEQGFDAAVRTVPGRAICMSAGNYYDKRIHASGQLRPTQERTFVWEINQAGHPTDNNELEIWYSWQDKFEVSVRSPDGSIAARAKIGERAKLMVGGKEVGNVYHRGQEPSSLDNHINFFLYKEAPSGPWEVTLYGSDVIDGRFHAWVERDVSCPRCQSHFRAEDADPGYTTGTICNGRRTIAVGAYNRHDPEMRLGHFSSRGPTRDGRLKPDLCAPGVSVLAARSAPRDMHNPPLLTRMSGTSMAAPHVTGTVALMFEAAPRRLRIEETHNLLLGSTRRVSIPEESPDRIGIGFLDVHAAVEAARTAGSGGPSFKQTVVEIPSAAKRESEGPAMQRSATKGTGIEAERVPKRPVDGGEAEREPKRQARTPVSEVAEVETETEARPAEHKCTCGSKDASIDVERDTELYGIPETETEVEAENAEDLPGCSGVSTDCFPSPDDLKKIRKKGKPEGDFNDRTEGDRSENLGLQLFDYDVNDWFPGKVRHVEAIGRIREFIVNRSVQTSDDIAVTITGSASHTGTKQYNDVLSCKRAICAGEVLRQQVARFRGVAERVKINPSGRGFTDAKCKGSDCELGEWRSVLIQVHAPGNQPHPIDPVDPGWDKYTIRCCSFHSENLACGVVGDLLKDALSKIPEFLRGTILKLFKKQLNELVKQLLTELPKLEAVVQGVTELLELFPGEIVRERGTFEINEHEKPNARGLVLCYSSVFGLRVLLPKQLDDFLDDKLGKILKNLPDFVKKEVKDKIKKFFSFVTKNVESDVPGPIAHFNLKEPRPFKIFEGAVQIGKAFWMPGQVNMEFNSKFWRLPRDPATWPKIIVPCPDTTCNEAGVQMTVGSGEGLELFCVSSGDLLAGSSCLCGILQPPILQKVKPEFEVSEAVGTYPPIRNYPAELVEVAEQTIVRRPGPSEAVEVLHKMLSHAGIAEALTRRGMGALPSAAEIFDSFSYGRGGMRDQLEQHFEIVAMPRAPLNRDLREADVVIRRGEGELAHVSVVASPKLRNAEALASEGLTPEIVKSGAYVQVVESGARPHSRGDNFARRITDSEGYVPHNTLVLRLRHPVEIAPSVPPESLVEWETGEPAHRVCTPFLSPVSSSDYLRYIQPETEALVKPLINGRSSGGTGADVDLTEPLDAMETAVKSLGPSDFVYLSAWFFEPATVLTAGTYKGATDWGSLLARKAADGVRVRLILNDFDPISGLDKWLNDTSLRPLNAIIMGLSMTHRDNLKYIVSPHPAHVGPIKSLLAGQGGRGIHVASHHQKFMVVKRGNEMTCFCGGLDIESRKTPALWSYAGLIGWHDLHVSMQGPVTRDFEREFVERWNREKGSSTHAALSGWRPFETLSLTPMTTADNTPAKRVHHVQMIRTVSVNATFSPYSNERDDIKRVYERNISCATDYIYMENQYFRSVEMADWIVKSGRAHSNLVVIIVVLAAEATDDADTVVTQHGDHLQFETFERIVKGLGNRVRLYTMKNRSVHAKFLMTDDRWMTIGSANANLRSFELDSELNLSIADNDLVSGFRRRLWGHNLGVTESTIAAWRVADFIPRWDAVAHANSLVTPKDMAGEGIVHYDYKSYPGKAHGSIPDALTNLDLAPEGRLFADTIPKGETTIRVT